MKSLYIGILAALLLPAAAQARPRHAHPHGSRVRVVTPAPAVRVVVSPWVYGYHPTPRDGWVWVEGHYNADGAWIPGYWAPSQPRPGYTWVPGHWDGDHYVEGYWRPAARAGFHWIVGYYDGGRWVEGYWAADASPPPEPPSPGAVHHDYDP